MECVKIVAHRYIDVFQFLEHLMIAVEFFILDSTLLPPVACVSEYKLFSYLV